jgi:hypothetical protein
LRIKEQETHLILHEHDDDDDDDDDDDGDDDEKELCVKLVIYKDKMCASEG